MLDLDKINSRLKKHGESRYGVSLVYFPNTAELTNVHKWQHELEALYGSVFIWSPVLHMSIVRCKSVFKPFAVKHMDLLCCNSVKREIVHSINADIGGDGILRLSFTEITLKGITEISPFYTSNDLQYDLITKPWISLGLIDITRENADEAAHSLQTRLADGQFPHFEMIINTLNVVHYRDILLKDHTLLKRIYLI